MQSDGLNSALSPVVYGHIVLSIKINTQIIKLKLNIDQMEFILMGSKNTIVNSTFLYIQMIFGTKAASSSNVRNLRIEFKSNMALTLLDQEFQDMNSTQIHVGKLQQGLSVLLYQMLL